LLLTRRRLQPAPGGKKLKKNLPRSFLTYQSSKNQWSKTGKGEEAKEGRGKRLTGAFLVQAGGLVSKPQAWTLASNPA
jgi:hypothetical protein